MKNFKPSITVYIKLFAITFVALIVGIIAFNYFKYTSSTLVIEMKTSQTGSGQVFWDTGKGYNGSESYRFSLKGTDRFETYAIPLPASKLNSVRLDPMDAPGAFEIKSFKIKGSNAEYIWSGEKLLKDLVLLQNVKKIVSNSDNFIGNATSDDPSLEIKNVPNNVFEKPIEERIKLSFLFTAGSFIIILFLINNKLIKRKIILNKRLVEIANNIKPFGKFMVVYVLPGLTAVYIFSFWILPQDWYIENELDGSWIYALGKLRSLNLSLGKDSWFSFGPVSHWFGPPMGLEHYQPWPYYVLGLFVVGLFFVCLKKIIEKTAIGFPVKAIVLVSFSLSLVFINNRLEGYLVVGTLLTFTTGYFYERSRMWWLYCLMILSIIGLLYKFSFGILSTLCFLIALVHAAISHLLKLRRALYLGSAYLLFTMALFVISSGSFNLFQYFVLGLEVSSKYSEVMVFHDSHPYSYGIAFLFAFGGMVIGLLAASKLPKYSYFAFFVSSLVSIFLQFKHGHVRADGHIMYFYANLAPFFIILILLAFSDYLAIPNRMKLVILLLSTFLLVTIFCSMTTVLVKKYPWLSTPQSWKKIGERFEAGLRGLGTEATIGKVDALKSRHEPLFSFLNKHCRSLAKSGKSPNITFYPWELMFAEAIEACTLKPSPGFQLYTSGPHSKIQYLEADFLASKTKPEIIVIGSRVIDGRNSVSEYSSIFPNLFRNYKVLAAIEDYVVLESSDANNNTTSGTIVCSEKSQGIQGEFLHLKLEPIGGPYEVLWRIATFLFKAPELTVRVSAKNQQNNNIDFSFRGYLSQLKHGVYTSNDTITKFILKNFRRYENVKYSTINQIPTADSISSEFIVDATATVSRNEGIWNLPVIPRTLPLQVQFCSF